LVEQLGGSPTPGVGFAAGIERILLACENEGVLNLPEDKLDLYIVKINKELTSVVFEIGAAVRRSDLSVDFDYFDRSVKAQMREANKLNARYVLFIGGEEYENGGANLKNMSTGEQQLIKIADKDGLTKIVKK
jgi:histidyl-tRNA synthetase